jgi:DNA polymerase elongation subunit (family B)
MPKVFDIETVANVEMFPHVPPPAVKYGNTKDEAKRKDIEEAAIKKQIQGMALSPLTGRICAYAVVHAEELPGNNFKLEKVTSGVLKTVDDNEERALIKKLLKEAGLSEPKRQIIVTFNGMDFDLPFIYGRAMMLGMVPLPLQLSHWTKRYSVTPHVDLRKVLTNWEYAARGSLHYFCKLILKTAKEEPDYQDFLDIFKAGKQDTIVEACAQHTLLIYELYRYVKPYYL